MRRGGHLRVIALCDEQLFLAICLPAQGLAPPHNTQLAKCNQGRENRNSNPYLNLRWPLSADCCCTIRVKDGAV